MTTKTTTAVEMPDSYGHHPRTGNHKRFTFQVVRLRGPDRTMTVWADSLHEAVDMMLAHERRTWSDFGAVIDWVWVATSDTAAAMRVIVKEPVR